MLGSQYIDAVAAAGGQDAYNAQAYMQAIDSIAPGAAAAGAAAATPGDFNSMLTAAMNAAQAIVTTDAQRKLLAVQLDRANKGLAPLDSSQYGLGVNVGLSPQTLQYVGYGLLALVAVFALTRRGR